MAQQTLPVSETVQVILRGHGSMRVTGWDRAEIALEADDFNPLRFEQKDNTVRVNCMDDCEMFIPVKAQVSVDKISGDARFTNLSGLVVVDRVGGGLSLLKIGEARVTRVSSDMRAKDIAGPLQIDHIGGSLDGLDLHAGLVVESVSGDINLNRVAGRVSARSGGTIQLGLLENHGPEIWLRASGDIYLHLPQDAGGNFNLTCSGQNHKIELGGRVNIIRSRDYQFTQGQDGAAFTLRAGGNIAITDHPLSEEPNFERRFARLEERITNRIRSQLEAVDRGTDIAERAARMAEEAVRRAEARLQAVMRDLETQPGFVVGVPRPPAPPRPAPPEQTRTAPDAPVAQPEPEAAGESVTDEERLLILRMLQEKKISVEQAEALMEALESREEAE